MGPFHRGPNFNGAALSRSIARYSTRPLWSLVKASNDLRRVTGVAKASYKAVFVSAEVSARCETRADRATVKVDFRHMDVRRAVLGRRYVRMAPVAMVVAAAGPIVPTGLLEQARSRAF